MADDAATIKQLRAELARCDRALAEANKLTAIWHLHPHAGFKAIRAWSADPTEHSL